METANLDKKDEDQSETPTLPVKRTIAIVQVLRLGDLIQTIQMAKGLREIHKDKYNLILVARKSFANSLKEMIDKVFDECITIDLNDLTLSSSSVTLENTISNIRAVTGKINSHAIEVCINLSFSKSSNYLMSLIEANHKIGPHYGPDATIRIKDKWSQYLYANVLESSQNPYNLVDLFNFVVGVTVDKTSKASVNHSNKNMLYVHPFASDPKKRWNDSKWVEVLFKFLKDNQDKKVRIVGAKSDEKDAQKILKNPLLKAFSDRIESICGKYSIPELKEQFTEDSFLVAHDSMVSHLAALKNIPIVTISMGPVRPHETTPYISGVYNLSPQTKCFPCKPDTNCDFYQCHADIPYQVVNEVLNSISNGNEITCEQLKDKLSHFHLNSTNIRVSSFDKAGVYRLENVMDDVTSYEDTIKSFYKLAWAYLFNEIEVEQDFPKLGDKTHSQLVNDMKGLQQFFELCEFGKKYSRYILEEISSKTPDIAKIKEFSNKVDEVDKLSEMVAEAFPQLTPLINFSKVSKSNLHGENLVELTESSFYSFHDTSTLTSIVYDLCEKALTKNQKNKNKVNNLDAR
jgi:ADP-heptose:LPS heptosyltransferase